MSRKKIEKNIWYEDKTDSYFVQFTFQDSSSLRSFPTLQEAKTYRDVINAEKLNFKIARDKRMIQQAIAKEADKILDIQPYPYNALKAMGFWDTNIHPDIIDNFDKEVLPSCCTEREIYCIQNVYAQKKTLEIVGKELKVTRERVRQIACKGLKKVRYYVFNYNDIKEREAQKEYLQKDLADRHAFREKLIEEYKKTGVITEEMNFEFGELKIKIKGEDPVLDTKIEDLDLSCRSFNCLRRSGMKTVRDIVVKTESELMKIRNLGKKCVKEIKNKLASMNLELGAEQWIK